MRRHALHEILGAKTQVSQAGQRFRQLLIEAKDLRVVSDSNFFACCSGFAARMNRGRLQHGVLVGERVAESESDHSAASQHPALVLRADTQGPCSHLAEKAHYTISYYIIPCHIISCHIMSYHIISYHIISYHIISHHIISYHIISYHIISDQIRSDHSISYHIISYHIMA